MYIGMIRRGIQKFAIINSPGHNIRKMDPLAAGLESQMDN